MPTDVEIAYAAIRGKQAGQSRLWRYYEGDHPLRYSTERLRELFNAIDVTFVENWASVVIDAALDRIHLDRFSLEDEPRTARLKEIFAETELDLDADDVHKAALVCGEAYVLAWREEDGIEAYYHDPRLCHLQYDPQHPRQKLWGAKLWEEDERYRLTLYYPDRLEYWVSVKKAEEARATPKANFTEYEAPAVNEYGQVPMFHFRKERRGIISELGRDVLSIQDAINKLLADMMIASEFGSVKQRWFVTNADVLSVKSAGNEHLILPAGGDEMEPTKVGEFSPADLQQFLAAIDKMAMHLAVKSRTPKHYLLQQGGDPSGEALLTMEAPLNRKVGRFVDRFKATWRQIGSFLLVLDGDPGVVVDAIFERPETVQPKTTADIRKTAVDAGIPLTTVLRREGWTQDQLDQMEEDRQQVAAGEQSSLASALLEQQRRFDQGQENTVTIAGQ